MREVASSCKISGKCAVRDLIVLLVALITGAATALAQTVYKYASPHTCGEEFLCIGSIRGDSQTQCSSCITIGAREPAQMLPNVYESRLLSALGLESIGSCTP